MLCSDPLSSVAYATEQIVLVLGLGGLALLHLPPWLGLGVVALLVVVVASYRQTCFAYPNGGGAYTVSRENRGVRASLVAASALLVDYVLHPTEWHVLEVLARHIGRLVTHQVLLIEVWGQGYDDQAHYLRRGLLLVAVLGAPGERRLVCRFRGSRIEIHSATAVRWCSPGPTSTALPSPRSMTAMMPSGTST